MRHNVNTIKRMHSTRAFEQWVSIGDSWEPDVSSLHLLGSVPDVDHRLPTMNKRQVRCSPQLIDFINGIPGYKKTDPPNAEEALSALLRSCFVEHQRMFIHTHSPLKLLATSHMCLDMAFVRAVRLASEWLGPDVMKAGYISTWPPPLPEAGL